MAVEAKLSRKRVTTSRRSRTKAAALGNDDLLFVYGTLMRGGNIHKLLKSRGVRFAGRARIAGDLYWFPEEKYPGARPTTRSNRYIYGELYGLREPLKTLRAVDKAEGCDEGLFERRRVFAVRDGKRVRAWAYFYTGDLNAAEAVPGGRSAGLLATA